jgi:hypothetical protein
MRPTSPGTLNWRKSTYSTYGENCVEIALSADTAAVRDSKDPNGPLLHMSRSTFTRFLRTLR